MKHRGGDRIHETLRHLTEEERKAYWEQRNVEMHELQRRLAEKRKSA
jgi:hypothetical protein